MAAEGSASGGCEDGVGTGVKINFQRPGKRRLRRPIEGWSLIYEMSVVALAKN